MAKEKINFEDEQVRSNYRHTTSHILAQAVKKLWPDAKLAIGNCPSKTDSTMTSTWSTSSTIRIFSRSRRK